MEQQKPKKIKVFQRNSSQSNSSSSSLPKDLTTEILLRLPEKSIAKFRRVSKLWLTITTDPYFIDLFETRYPRPSLLICYKEGENLFVSSIPQHRQTLELDSNKSYSYHMNLPKHCIFLTPTESVHGLICFQGSNQTPIVWNPSTRHFLALPKPRLTSAYLSIFLGYDPTKGKHKVMCIPFNKNCDVCWVLTLGSSQKTWRTVNTNYMHRSRFFNPAGRCIKGVIYYLAYVDLTCAWVIMSFDVRTEKFDMIPFPTHVYTRMLVNYEGRLACIEKNTSDDTIYTEKKNGVRFWILEDAKHKKWSSKDDFLAPYSYYDETLGNHFALKGITRDGEFIYVPAKCIPESIYVLFCDPARNSFRRFQLEQVVDKKSNLSLKTYLHAFTSHVESQNSM